MTYKVTRINLNEDEDIFTEENIIPAVYTDNQSNFLKYFIISCIAHPIAVLILWLLFMILTFLNILVPMAHKPDWKTKDIEFVLTQNEQTPINKRTPYRSDKNSRAGGKHDPTRKVSMPSPAPAPAPKAPQIQPKPQAKAPQTVQKTVQTPVKNIVKTPTPAPVQKQQAAPAKTVSKPTKINAPTQKPVLRPSPTAPKTQMPKLSTAPTSPFQVQVPKTSAPVGKGFSTAGGTASTGGGATYSGNGTSGSGMPAPQFSTTRTASSATRGTSTGSRTGTGTGGYGTGNMGNPGPGNPSGAPGIDAIKSPQWGPYMRELESKIKRNWFPPKGDKSKRVVLLFKIGKRGELISVRVSKSSGAADNDQAAIKAVQLSAPFRALPPEFTGSSVEIEFTFDYNVLGASYR